MPSSAEEKSTDILDRRVQGIYVEGVHEQAPTTLTVFSRILSKVRLPGGMVRVADSKRESRVPKQLLPSLVGSLREVLNEIVRNNPSLKWQAERGVINFLPSTAEPDFLKTRISEFRLDNATSPEFAVSALLGFAPVIKAMRDLLLSGGLERLQGPRAISRTGTPLPVRGFSVNCENVTLREALNAIVLAEGHSLWVYDERHYEGRNEVTVESVQLE